MTFLSWNLVRHGFVLISAIVTSWLGFCAGGSAAVAGAPAPTTVQTYVYDSHSATAVSTYTTSECGPPANDTANLDSDAVGPGPDDASVRPESGSIWTYTAFGHPVQVAHADSARVTTRPPPDGNGACLRVVPGASVAAKFEDGAHRLIGANRATIDPRKLTEYALNPNHPEGSNKARVFESALGFNRSNADDLMSQLRQGVMENTPIPGKVDKWGTRFTVDIPVTGPAGSGVVRTGWIYAPGSITPSLNTLLVR